MGLRRHFFFEIKFSFLYFESIKLKLQHDDEVGLVSIMQSNNEVGNLNDVDEFGKICRAVRILFHTDCVQSAGVIAPPKYADFASISSHKIHGPKGVGALCLFGLGSQVLEPIIHGGNAQERGFRAGTENVAGIVGFGKACEIAKRERDEFSKRIICLKKAFYGKLRAEMRRYGVPNKSVWINGQLDALSKVISVTFKGVDAETLVLSLYPNDVYVSAGAACESHESVPSHVLKAIGYSDEAARSTIRVSLSSDTTKEDILTAVKTIAMSVAYLRPTEYFVQYSQFLKFVLINSCKFRDVRI